MKYMIRGYKDSIYIEESHDGLFETFKEAKAQALFQLRREHDKWAGAIAEMTRAKASDIS